MTSRLTVFVVVLQVLVATKLSLGKYLRDINLKEFKDLAGSTSGSFVAVYFDNAASRKNYPFFLKEFRKAADPIDQYGVELLRLNCKGLEDDVQECKESNVYTYRNGIQEDSYGLDVLFDQHSVMSNLLSSLIKHEVEHVDYIERVQEILQAAKLNNKIVVFAYVKGFGTVDHATFMKIAYVFADDKKFDFVVTTDSTIADKIKGLSMGGFLAVHYCKGVTYDSDEPCRVFRPQKKKSVEIAQLLELLQRPKYDILSKNGTSVYDGLTLSVNKAYIFTRDPNDLNKEELEKFADEFFGYLGIVIVNIRKHKKMLSKFGLSKESTFPTGAFVPVVTKDTDEPFVELFPEGAILFTLDNFKHLLREYLRNPNKQYKIDATSYYLQTMPYSEFSAITSKELLPGTFLVAAHCEKDITRSECRDFSRYFRRLVRTFVRHDASNVNFVHVILSHDGDNEIGTPNRPHIRIWSGDHPDKFEVFKGTPDYNGLMNFLEKKTKISPTKLPPSNSDELPVAMDGDLEENTEEEKNEEEQQAADEERVGEGDAPPEEVEDDEVAGAVWYSETPTVPEDQIPSLTDKTFQTTRDSNDLLVVKFFQPWDARSRAFIGPYIEAAQSLGKFDVGQFNIRLARVNCFDWTDVCQHNNITTYPTIKLYRKGLDEFIYRGPLDSDNIIKTVLLLQNESPLKLENENQVNLFLTGRLPSNCDKTGQVSVLGLFATNDRQDFKSFTEAAGQLRGSFMFGYVSGKDAAAIAASYGTKSPGIFIIKRNDAIRPRVVYSGDFSTSNIVDFVRMSSLKSFGELTPMNLPLYHRHGRPLVIAFRATSVDDKVYSPILEQLADDDTLRSKAFFTWIALSSNDVNEVILKSYTQNNEVPVLVIVNKKLGLVYQFRNKPTLEEVSDWTKRCLSGEENPSSRLKQGRWEPLLEGYDYLSLIDKEEKEKEKKSEDMLGEDEGSIGEAQEPREESTGPAVVEKSRLRQPLDLREEHEKKRDEL